jgi:ABC-2 type transport system ATP-binding protein
MIAAPAHEIDPASPDAAGETIIKADAVTRRFGQVVAVDAVTFHVARGEIFAFLGPNGAGKTTTIRMLTTLLPPTSGSIEVAGFDPVSHAHDVRARFGIVFQDPSIDGELTIYETLELHGVLYRLRRAERRDRIERLLVSFGLWDRRTEYVKRLSGGLKRRVEIVRGLLHAPEVLFLDEPTLGLDPQSRRQLWSHVLDMNRQERTTVFLTTHYMEEAERVADRVAIIDHGRLAAQGSVEALKQQYAAESLEEVFLTATGTAPRDVTADPAELMRQVLRVGRR